MNSSVESYLLPWVQQQLAELGSMVGQTGDDIQLVPLSGDAGMRQYFRVAGVDMPLLAVNAPPHTEDNALFVALGRALGDGGLCTPKVYGLDVECGFLLIQDFGDSLLHTCLRQQPANADSLYGQALISLLSLQQIRLTQPSLPSYDQTLLMQEMGLFNEWFLAGLLHQSSHQDDQGLVQIFNQLADCCLSQPQVLVHRDYHSRNLIVREAQPLGVIDYQGAVWGPITYDVVSLLKDCYLLWPESKVQNWALSYARLAMDAQLLPPVSEAEFLRWFDWTGLQRHIKVLGIFARLSLRDGKHHYLQDLPRVLQYVRATAKRYTEFSYLVSLLDNLAPLIESQPWYQSVAEIGR